MDLVNALQSYIGVATRYAFPTLVASLGVYVVTTVAADAWRQRKRVQRQGEEDGRRRAAYERRLAQPVAEQPADSSAREEPKPSAGGSFVLRPRAPASTRNSGFGSSVATLASTRPRVTGPSRSCAIGGGGCCG
ncbi:hypothetical protein LPJ53_001256 [Coemansia erecta]|uniref:Transmembrane protein n=1 Tax=Coemansia erecta TaxID=147472 RepID=A0A9W7Y0E5_9FUNG|nr:hypothetical protein LPJ53_001256 [Coemansia erecta]